jgi:PhzF family phenazine biosynthesis protein
MRGRTRSVNPGLSQTRRPRTRGPGAEERLTGRALARLHRAVFTVHVIAAFAHTPSAGNPAAVCLLKEPTDQPWMQRVARTMNLSETAFLHRDGDGFPLRWFTPQKEVELCGHATLASAFVLWETGELPAGDAARFHTKSGMLTCRKDGDWITMDFPATPVQPWVAPASLAEDLGGTIVHSMTNGVDGLVEVPDAATLRRLAPDWRALERLGLRGVIATCRSEDSQSDFLSRFFAPAIGVNEDQVTGSAHCALAPYWAERLGRNSLTGYQASARGGTVRVELCGERVVLSGQAVRLHRIVLPDYPTAHG